MGCDELHVGRDNTPAPPPIPAPSVHLSSPAPEQRQCKGELQYRRYPLPPALLSSVLCPSLIPYPQNKETTPSALCRQCMDELQCRKISPLRTPHTPPLPPALLSSVHLSLNPCPRKKKNFCNISGGTKSLYHFQVLWMEHRPSLGLPSDSGKKQTVQQKQVEHACSCVYLPPLVCSSLAKRNKHRKRSKHAPLERGDTDACAAQKRFGFRND